MTWRQGRRLDAKAGAWQKDDWRRLHAGKDAALAPEGETAVVALRLRGQEGMTSTFVGVLERYAERLQAIGGKLVLSGVSEPVWQRLVATETTESIPEKDVFLSDDALGSSTHKALEAAR